MSLTISPSPPPHFPPLYSGIFREPSLGFRYEEAMRGADGDTKHTAPAERVNYLSARATSPNRDLAVSPSHSTSPTQTASSISLVQFTFINQHSDIRSVRDRRIQNPDHRHEIRSHVMRNVRSTEHAQGYKRPTGRAPARTKSKDRRNSKVITGYDPMSESDSVKKESPPTSGQSPLDPTAMLRRSSYSTPPMYTWPDRNHGFDPFWKMPTGGLLSQDAADRLLQYCFSIFLPMTFPVESKQSNGRSQRKDLVIRVQTSNPATFFGFLATVACHRAVLYKRFKSCGAQLKLTSNNITCQEFGRAHQDAITATNAKIERDEVSDPDFLEACYSLISTTTIVGDFEEARLHLKGVQNVVKRVDVPEYARAWLPLADIKAALGLLDRPRVPIPWAPTNLGINDIEQMLPHPSNPLYQMATGFADIPISAKLRGFLMEAAILCHMIDYNARSTLGLSFEEHNRLRNKCYELEHDLLDYVFDTFPSKEGENGPSIPVVEQVIRMAVIGILNTVCVFVLPGCGLGRALTQHQLNAVNRWFDNEINDVGHVQGHYATLKAVTWALFVFAQCAEQQLEAQEFRSLLLLMTKRLWLMSWDEVEATVYKFLYVPSVVRPNWRETWQYIERWRSQQRETPTEIDGPGR